MPTKIPWCVETLNPWVGCEKIRAGCLNCYAERCAYRLAAMGQENYKKVLDGRKWNGKIAYQLEQLEKLKYWRKGRTVFIGSMTDIFHEDVPFELIVRIFDAMHRYAQHTYLITTKRPDRAFELSQKLNWLKWPKCLWRGISCSTQKDLDEMAPILFQIPSAHYWLSGEPLLEDLQMGRYIGGWDEDGHCKKCGLAKEEGIEVCDCPPGFGPKFSWVVVGAESGPHRRPCDIEHVRSIVRQCKDAGVAVYVKQLDIDGKVLKDPKDFPEDLRIREIPKR